MFVYLSELLRAQGKVHEQIKALDISTCSAPHPPYCKQFAIGQYESESW